MAATKKAVDFTDVKDASPFSTRRVPAGDYKATITAVDDHVKSGEKGSHQWVFTISLVGRARCTYPYYVEHVDKKFAWKIRNIFLAAGMAVPKKKVMVDPNKLVGKTIGVTMEDDEYEGREKSVIGAVFPESEVTSTPGKGSSTDDDEVEDVEVEDDASDDEDLDEVDLEEV